MDGSLSFFMREGSAVLFLCVLAEQCGLPLPAAPALMAMGALAMRGHFAFAHLLFISVLAASMGDQLWYYLGRTRGQKVLRFLCKISLEPDSCVRSTTNSFARYGARSLLFSKFVPGLATVAPPMAGLSGISQIRFTLFSLAGSTIWAGAYLAIGAIFHRRLEQVLAALQNAGAGVGLALGTVLGFWLGWKFWQRQSFLRKIRLARITPQELYDLMLKEHPLVIFDLRAEDDMIDSGHRLPGAKWMDPTSAGADILAELREDFEVILYCS